MAIKLKRKEKTKKTVNPLVKNIIKILIKNNNNNEKKKRKKRKIH